MPARKINWDKLKMLAQKLAAKRHLGGELLRRLKFELKEIERQGANAYWVDLFNNDHHYDTNDNGLVLPWLLGMTKIDPLLAEHKIEQSTDYPDIDVDCLPSARDNIKSYAAQKFGEDFVCSVGTWMTYKFRSALQDACRTMGGDLREAMALTETLPDGVDDLKDGGRAPCASCYEIHDQVSCPKCGSRDIDGLTIGAMLEEYEALTAYNASHPEIVDAAVRLVGRIKTMGKHAGGVIISSQRLMGNVPMALSRGVDGSAQWTSMWTEGRSPQLSKLGYIKWDFLGLKTLQYIHHACKSAERTRNVRFNVPPWKDNDPEINCAGWYLDEKGKKQNVPMDDPDVFKMINDLRVETVFQFETDVQRGALSNGVRDYYDLQVYNAMGHPGPIACIRSHSKIDIEGGDKEVQSLDRDNDKLAYMEKSGELNYTQNYKVIRTGRRRFIKLRTADGRVIEVTPDHRVLTDRGYVSAGNLSVGSKIAIRKD